MMRAAQEKRAELPCVLCETLNSTKWRFPTVDDMYLSIACCANCGHVYQCPQIDKSYAAAHFAEAYGESGPYHPYFDPELKLQHAKDMFRVLRARCPEARRVLEVGAGRGAFAHVARTEGLQVVATEMSETAVRKARELYGVDLHFGPVEELPPGDPFDAAVLWDVIEHCPDPASVLEAVSSRLRAGGKVLLTTGNYECVNRLVSGEKWWCWRPDHYHYFSPGNMSRLGHRVGLADFQIERVARIDPRGGEPTKKPNPLRFLNLARLAKVSACYVWAVLRWPDHWNIGVMLCSMAKQGRTPS
jgi:2-polyprenyl-3-methyl-5-hydroxy-6-metoxy-1,4-benzoquinol methylase